MNEAHENQYLELDSVKTEIEPTIYDDVVAESSTPALEKTSYEMCSREAVKKKQASADLENACQRDVVVLRRMLFFMSAVVVVALLTAAAALLLTISAMKGKHYYAYLRSRQVLSVSQNIHKTRSANGVNIYGLLAKLLRSGWLDIGQVPFFSFCVFMERSGVQPS